MNKGLVMEIKDSYIIILSDNGGFDKIQKKPGLTVGKKIFYFDEDIIQAKNYNSFNMHNIVKIMGSVAAMILIMFTFFDKYPIEENIPTNIAYAVVSLDINPSIQIEADNNKKIISIEGKNDDGKKLDLAGIKGLDIEKGIEKIEKILSEKQYLSKNRDILVGLAFADNTDNNDYEKLVKDKVYNTFKSQNITYIRAEQNEDIRKAEECGISLGRYEASKVVDDETKKNIVEAPVKQITEQIKDKKDVIHWDAYEDEDVAKDFEDNQEKNNDSMQEEINSTPSENIEKPKEILDKNENKNVEIDNSVKTKDNISDEDKMNSADDNEKKDIISDKPTEVLELEPEESSEEKVEKNFSKDNNQMKEEDTQDSKEGKEINIGNEIIEEKIEK